MKSIKYSSNCTFCINSHSVEVRNSCMSCKVISHMLFLIGYLLYVFKGNFLFSRSSHLLYVLRDYTRSYDIQQ